MVCGIRGLEARSVVPCVPRTGDRLRDSGRHAARHAHGPETDQANGSSAPLARAACPARLRARSLTEGGAVSAPQSSRPFGSRWARSGHRESPLACREVLAPNPRNGANFSAGSRSGHGFSGDADELAERVGFVSASTAPRSTPWKRRESRGCSPDAEIRLICEKNWRRAQARANPSPRERVP
jgi:hypothetical protein